MSDHIWMRSVKYHTYWNLPRDPDTFYQVDTQQDADTLVALKFAERDEPPAKAKRPAAPSPAPPALQARTQAAAAIQTAPAPIVQQPPKPAAPIVQQPAAIMTTADHPTTKPPR